MDVKQQQAVFHDWEADRYDDKWAIGFDDRCTRYVVGRYLKAVPSGQRFGRVLEVGCGTGFFLLNLAQAGFVGEAHSTDLSARMVARCVANGRSLGIRVRGKVADAEQLPYPDDSFDLVVGHAVLHHLPNLDAAFTELRRVLRPGGQLVIAGEPSELGDAIANRVKQGARIAAKVAALIAGAERVLGDPMAHLPDDERSTASLEHVVDLHVFTPSRLEQLAVRAGFVDVRAVTEELTASWFGWATRTVEAMVRPGVLPERYPWIAYRVWQALFALDNHVAARVVPGGFFYNCILSARTPSLRLVPPTG